jgi:hypothetical protein
VDSASLIASLLCPAVVLFALCYAALCAASPFGSCRHCAGTGRRDAGRGRSRRPCRHCDATGLRIRYGRHLWNVAARIHRNGTR